MYAREICLFSSNRTTVKQKSATLTTHTPQPPPNQLIHLYYSHLLMIFFTTGCPPKDIRGRHKSRPHRLPDRVTAAIRAHISSFRGRHSHYAFGKTRKLYLSAELNVSKMHAFFRDTHSDIEITYETYCRFFVKDFNVGFGYPRKDPRATCDELVDSKTFGLAQVNNKKEALLN